jgi:hypothetical protein
MKTILLFLLLAALALVARESIPALAFLLVATVLLIGDLVALPEIPACEGECEQGRKACTCRAEQPKNPQP